jgi:hypothetical protein
VEVKPGIWKGFGLVTGKDFKNLNKVLNLKGIVLRDGF